MNIIRRALLHTAGWALKGAGLSLSDPAGWQTLGVGSTWAKVNV